MTSAPSVSRISIILAVLIVAALALPRWSEAGDVIACVHKSSGIVRVVAASSACANSETVVSLATPSAPSPRGSVTEGVSQIFALCDPPLSVLTIPVTLTQSSIVTAFASALPQRDSTVDAVAVDTSVELLSSGSVVARRQGTSVVIHAGTVVTTDSVVSGPLLNPATDAIYTAAPGTYELRLRMRAVFGLCSQSIFTTGGSQLSFVTEPS